MIVLIKSICPRLITRGNINNIAVSDPVQAPLFVRREVRQSRITHITSILGAHQTKSMSILYQAGPIARSRSTRTQVARIVIVSMRQTQVMPKFVARRPQGSVALLMVTFSSTHLRYSGITTNSAIRNNGVEIIIPIVPVQPL